MSDLVTNNNDAILLLSGDDKTKGSKDLPDNSKKIIPDKPEMIDERKDEILKYINLNRSLHLLNSDKYLTILE